MKIIEIRENFVKVMEEDGFKKIFFNSNSGKILFRYKKNTLIPIKHPCVYIGKDMYGKDFVVHNHYYQFNTAALDTLQNFAKGERIYEDKRLCSNNKYQIIQNALLQAQNKAPYDVVSYNCQTTVNMACSNTRKSEAINNTLGVLAVIGSALLIKSLSKTK